jgi:hypothetical protein
MDLSLILLSKEFRIFSQRVQIFFRKTYDRLIIYVSAVLAGSTGFFRGSSEKRLKRNLIYLPYVILLGMYFFLVSSWYFF